MKQSHLPWMMTVVGLLLLTAPAWATTYDLSTNTAYDLNIIGWKSGDQIGQGGILTADVDADGNADLLINAYNADYNSNSDVGALYIILNIQSRTGTIDLNADKPIKDFNVAIFGSAGSDFLGFNGVGIGEIDRDGKFNDIAVGASFADPKSRDAAGAIYVFQDINSESGIINLALASGRAKVDLNILGAVASDNLGWAQTSFGDSNSDGYKDDLVIGGQGATYNGNAGAGCVYLINGVGSKLGSIDLLSTSAVNLKVCGNAANDAVGYEGNFFADLDLDGYEDDWVFGEWQGSSTSSDALQFIKSAGLESGTITDASAVIDLNILGASIRQSFCIRPCVFGDYDNDGNSTDDFFLTAGAADPLSRTDAGQVMVFQDLRLDGTVINLNANSGKAKVDLNIYGSVASDGLGWGGISMGDLDGDGRKETMAVGAYGHDPLGRSAAGIVYLFDDVTTLSGIIDLNSPGSAVDHNFVGAVAGDNLGFTSPHFADTDNDGYVDDLFIGAYTGDPAGRNNAGTIWLYKLSNGVSVSTDVNVWKIDGNPDAQPLPVFSYAEDGNLTLDFNITGTNTLLLDVNYSTSTTQGSGSVIVNDLNLASLSTTGVYSCADTNFADITRCSVDWNIAGLGDTNYYILAYLTNGVTSNYESSDASFLVDTNGSVLSISSPSDGSTSTESSVTVTYSATDAASGIASYSVSTDGSTYTSNGTNTTYTFSSLANGSYTFYVRATDNAGNATVDSVTVTVSIPAEESDSNDEGSNAPNAGTPFAPPPIAPPITAEKTASFNPSPPGIPTILNFHHSYLHPIEKVSFVSTEELPPVVLTISSYGDVPSPPEEVEACDTFTANLAKPINAVYAATIHFRVNKKCIEEKGATSADVVLYHHDDEWMSLSTQLDFQTEDEYYFTATTNGFSPFLIGVKKNIPIEEEPPIIQEEIPLSETVVPIIQENEAIPTVQPVQENQIMGIFVFVLFGWILFIRFRKPGKKHLDGW